MKSSRESPASGPRQHLLETASRLFYLEGINAVGVDRILQQAGVTRATLYRHFAGKEALVVAYLEREDALIRHHLEAAADRAVSPDHMLELVIEGIAEDAWRHHTRGCPFINATAEFPDPANPVRQVVSRHRVWFRAVLEEYLTAAGREDSAIKADTLVMLRDAVLVGSYLDDSEASRRTFLRTARCAAGLP
ncbi:TetR/AcrR family transcriptional regulator [Planotetraspora mira]|jgi:AcrR family transcriptional regulator|uniref:TetR family transcriptional regulator n=1 Tax=Planotetraspora mira TaxID=58121 RepID=A0A8J3X9J9_9ACTN|nr:TetR/AcrR family transcriptional regulator [Planotetraspora mira]GII32496.1 TetR family transcriptional regulator [Planotetraspora mira]